MVLSERREKTMPESAKRISVVFFRTPSGTEPVREWIQFLATRGQAHDWSRLEDTRMGLAGWNANLSAA